MSRSNAPWTAAAILLVASSCASEPLCVPGITNPCLCATARMGAQICNPEGTGYGPCLCEDPRRPDAGDSVDAAAPQDAGIDNTDAADDASTPAPDAVAADATEMTPDAHEDASVSDEDAGFGDAEVSEADAGTQECRPCGGTFSVENNFVYRQLQGCSSVAGRISFFGVPWLQAIDLPCLRRADEIQIRSISTATVSMPQLSEVSGMFSVRTAGSGFTIVVPRLSSVGRLTVESNRHMQSLSWLSALNTVQGNLQISENDALRDLNGLNGVVGTVGSLNISGNTGLLSLTGLPQSLAIIGDLHFERHPCIPQRTVETYLSRMVVGGVRYVRENGRGIGSAACP